MEPRDNSALTQALWLCVILIALLIIGFLLHLLGVS